MANSTKVRRLYEYTACDISDALLKLKVPKAGFLADLNPHAPHLSSSAAISTQPKLIAPASTVLFVPKHAPSWSSLPAALTPTSLPPTNIPQDTHYVDLTESGTVVVMSQPQDQTCAVLGGIMATRMKVAGALGVVVDGRVRDVRELRELEMPVWARATSTVGTGAEAKPWAVGVPVTVAGVMVCPGDIIFADPIDGVAVIPKDKLDAVLELLPCITQADEKVLEFVRKGGLVGEAFEKFRQGL